MKLISFVLLSLFIAGCSSDQRSDQDGLQREEEQEKQVEHEEYDRTGASDDLHPEL